ncbi:hypothetical protein [Pseudomonas phage LUZ7]|uniref:Uncharacterized protein n=1 Tax=Pseudomonas phage LUZ7 TaxID=655097 RepID=C8ZKA3_9CAUD|nr:hypothetical protein PP-LUZ7_gp004 [Pseudomonas phage LUZ7]CAZ66145.1 hypothetical protein [Pseudomonas phage LUZ7]
MTTYTACPEEGVILEFILCGEPQAFKLSTIEEAFAVVVGLGFDKLFDVTISYWDLDCNRQVWRAELISRLLAQATITLEGEGYATHVKVVL